MIHSTLALAAIAAAAFTLNPQAAEAPAIPRPDDKPADMTKPVQVFILMGQARN